MKFLTLILILSFVLSGMLLASDYDKNWPQWRGPLANGISPDGNPPVEWSETKNVKWKVEIPGRGLATPIVWDNQLIILTAIETDKAVGPEEPKEEENQQGRRSWMSARKSNKLHKFDVISINRKTGEKFPRICYHISDQSVKV